MPSRRRNDPPHGEWVVAFRVPNDTSYTVMEPLVRCRDCTHFDEVSGCGKVLLRDRSGTLRAADSPGGFCFKAEPRAPDPGTGMEASD